MNNDIIKKQYDKRLGVTVLKQFRKVISLILCMALTMSFSAMAVAPEDGVQPYTEFEIKTATATASSSGSSLVINFDIRASESCSKIGIDSINGQNFFYSSRHYDKWCKTVCQFSLYPDYKGTWLLCNCEVRCAAFWGKCDIRKCNYPHH